MNKLDVDKQLADLRYEVYCFIFRAGRNGRTVAEICMDYQDAHKVSMLPIAEFGFPSLQHFLESFPDDLALRWTRKRYYAVATDSTAHLANFVQNQTPSKLQKLGLNKMEHDEKSNWSKDEAGTEAIQQDFEILSEHGADVNWKPPGCVPGESREETNIWLNAWKKTFSAQDFLYVRNTLRIVINMVCATENMEKPLVLAHRLRFPLNAPQIVYKYVGQKGEVANVVDKFVIPGSPLFTVLIQCQDYVLEPLYTGRHNCEVVNGNRAYEVSLTCVGKSFGFFEAGMHALKFFYEKFEGRISTACSFTTGSPMMKSVVSFFYKSDYEEALATKRYTIQDEFVVEISARPQSNELINLFSSTRLAAASCGLGDDALEKLKNYFSKFSQVKSIVPAIQPVPANVKCPKLSGCVGVIMDFESDEDINLFLSERNCIQMEGGGYVLLTKWFPKEKMVGSLHASLKLRNAKRTYYDPFSEDAIPPLPTHYYGAVYKKRMLEEKNARREAEREALEGPKKTKPAKKMKIKETKLGFVLRGSPVKTPLTRYRPLEAAPAVAEPTLLECDGDTFEVLDEVVSGDEGDDSGELGGRGTSPDADDRVGGGAGRIWGDSAESDSGNYSRRDDPGERSFRGNYHPRGGPYRGRGGTFNDNYYHHQQGYEGGSQRGWSNRSNFGGRYHSDNRQRPYFDRRSGPYYDRQNRPSIPVEGRSYGHDRDAYHSGERSPHFSVRNSQYDHEANRYKGRNWSNDRDCSPPYERSRSPYYRRHSNERERSREVGERRTSRSARGDSRSNSRCSRDGSFDPDRRSKSIERKSIGRRNNSRNNSRTRSPSRKTQSPAEIKTEKSSTPDRDGRSRTGRSRSRSYRHSRDISMDRSRNRSIKRESPSSSIDSRHSSPSDRRQRHTPDRRRSPPEDGYHRDSFGRDRPTRDYCRDESFSTGRSFVKDEYDCDGQFISKDLEDRPPISPPTERAWSSVIKRERLDSYDESDLGTSSNMDHSTDDIPSRGLEHNQLNASVKVTQFWPEDHGSDYNSESENYRGCTGAGKPDVVGAKFGYDSSYVSPLGPSSYLPDQLGTYGSFAGQEIPKWPQSARPVGPGAVGGVGHLNKASGFGARPIAKAPLIVDESSVFNPANPAGRRGALSHRMNPTSSTFGHPAPTEVISGPGGSMAGGLATFASRKPSDYGDLIKWELDHGSTSNFDVHGEADMDLDTEDIVDLGAGHHDSQGMPSVSDMGLNQPGPSRSPENEYDDGDDGEDAQSLDIVGVLEAAKLTGQTMETLRAENLLDPDVLAELSEGDMKELNIAVGDRKRIAVVLKTLGY